MQKMQRYFGFRVKVADFLEPTDYKLAQKKLCELVEQGRLDISRYKIYLHQLALEADTTHFGLSGGIEKRIEKILLRFSINPKQRKSGDIQFANNLVARELNEENKPFYLSYEVGYTIPSYFFREKDWFQNVLVTLVRNGVREDHRKIKIRVSAEASLEYVERLRRDEYLNTTTILDMDFKKAVDFNRQIPLFSGNEYQFKKIGENTVSSNKTRPSKNTIKINGNVTGLQSGSLNSSQCVTVTNNNELLEHVIKELKNFHAQILADKTSQILPKDLAVIEGVLAEAPKNPEALSRLKSLGTWFGTRVEKVGLTLLAGIIKDELGV
jgi:hypothetical protein